MWGLEKAFAQAVFFFGGSMGGYILLAKELDFTAIEAGIDEIEYRILRMYDDNYLPVSVYPSLAAGA